MSKQRLFSVLVLFVAWLASQHIAAAGNGKAVCVPPNCAPCCCPDYSAKPWPCLPCKAPQCCCDDYCKKPIPGACAVTPCLCDDYCKKPTVCLPGIPCLPWNKCYAPPCPQPAGK